MSNPDVIRCEMVLGAAGIRCSRRSTTKLRVMMLEATETLQINGGYCQSCADFLKLEYASRGYRFSEDQIVLGEVVVERVSRLSTTAGLSLPVLNLLRELLHAEPFISSALDDSVSDYHKDNNRVHLVDARSVISALGEGLEEEHMRNLWDFDQIPAARVVAPSKPARGRPKKRKA